MLIEKIGRKAQAGVFLIGFLIIIVLVFLFLPYISYNIGLVSPPNAGPITQGIKVSSVNYPASVSPSSTFGLSFFITNNLNGMVARNINFCLDDLGLFTISSSPFGSFSDGRCIRISSLFAGGVIGESFSLVSPSNSYYANIPYTQDLGYYINYSYSSTASQEVEFVSSQSSSSGSFPAPPVSISSRTAGPISINTSISQPIIYGNDGALAISFSNTGSGVVFGYLSFNITMNSSQIEIPSPSVYGLSEKTLSGGLVIYNGSVFIGSGVASLTFPVGLNSAKASELSSSDVPYYIPTIKLAMSYEYEQDGFFPISLQSERYFI
ncbi:hypothetical protein M1293_03630 [Candidatus Parvarchaeota archaeon]|nr:hypothetical protein [Candidatus Parvarchaeota archaeon]